MGRQAVAAAVIGTVLALTACEYAPDPPVVPVKTLTRLTIAHGDDGAKAVILAGPFTEYAERGPLRGVITADAAGCFTIKDLGGDTWTLVFPEGSTVHGPAAVLLPDATTLQIGGKVLLSGGVIPANESASACLNYARLYLVDAVSPSG